MKTLACKNMGNSTCDFVAVGQTTEEVLDKMVEHHETAHPEDLIRMSENDFRIKTEALVEES